MRLLTNLSLQKRIGLFVLVGLTVGLGLFSWFGIQSVNEGIQRTLEERLTVARVVANHLDGNLSHVLQHSANAADFNGHFPTEEEFRGAAISLHQMLQDSEIPGHNILLVDQSGQTLGVEPAGSKITPSYMFRYPEVKEAMATGRANISGLVLSPITDEPAILISAPILNEAKEAIGAIIIISANTEQSGIGAFSQTITVGKTGYTEVIDGNGIVLARSSPASPPASFERSDHPGRFAQLISQGQATVGVCHRCHESKGEIERRRDMLAFAPLSTASWGVAIRQSEEEALAPGRQLGSRLLLVGMTVLAGTLLLLWTMMQGVVRPIKTLTAATKRVAGGDFKATKPVKRQDEVGELSTAFYSMTQELARSRDDLMARNEELAAINSIAATVNQSLKLEDVLGNTLQKVLEVTRAKIGCVFLREPQSEELRVMSSSGRATVFQCREAGSPSANCTCHQVLRHGQTVMVNDITQCPRLDEMMLKDTGVSSFVSLPLKSKDRTLGIMNVASSAGCYFTEDDFRLLDSIGYHIGLAIENSVLYEEAKQREELRGQLLNRVISAQEEERRRIARELHDGFGQTLTGLVMSIESLENASSAQEPQLRERLRHNKELVGRALEDLRRLTVDLRPSVLDDLGLIAAIRSHIQSHLAAAGIEAQFETKGFSGKKHLAPAIETALFRIIQEASHNIIRHARAHQTKIQLELTDKLVTAIIEDDGKGFDVDAVLQSRHEAQTLGLLGIQERVTLLGGTFAIKSAPGKGARLIVEIPLPGLEGEPSLQSGQTV